MKRLVVFLFIFVFFLPAFSEKEYKISIKVILNVQDLAFNSYSFEEMNGIREFLKKQIDSVSMVAVRRDVKKKNGLQRFSKRFPFDSNAVPTIKLPGGQYSVFCTGGMYKMINGRFISENIFQSDVIKMEVKDDKFATFYLNRLACANMLVNLVLKYKNKLIDAQELVIKGKKTLLVRDIMGGNFGIKNLKIPRDTFSLILNKSLPGRSDLLSGFTVVFDIAQMAEGVYPTYIADLRKLPEFSWQ